MLTINNYRKWLDVEKDLRIKFDNQIIKLVIRLVKG